MLSTMMDFPLTVSQILLHGAQRHGDAQVTTWTETSTRQRSFAEVAARAAQLAHALRELGVDGDQRVGTLMWNNAEHLEAYLAVPSMGAVLHTINPRLPTEQLAWIVNHAADHVLLINDTLLPMVQSALPLLNTVEHIVVVGGGDLTALVDTELRSHRYEELIAGRATEFEWPEVNERSAAALCYTSGTTGDPKGVAYSHRSVYLHALQVNCAESFGLWDGSVVMPVVPMFHVNAWGMSHAAFMAGASMLMPDRFLQPDALAEMIVTGRPTIAAAVPTLWTGLLAELDARPRDVSSLESVIVGGSACPPALMQAFQKRHGMRVIQAWGMTETSPLGTVSHPPAGVTGAAEWPYRVTQGRFPASVQSRLRSPSGEQLPHDGTTSGELEVRGPWITSAYYGGVGGTPLRPGSSFTEDGWLRTGDIATISTRGYLTITDRAKDLIKSGGEWISSVDLENALMAHPEVVEAAVIAIPDQRWEERPLAVVVLKDGGAPNYPAYRAHLAERFANWQIPERWTVLPSLPKTTVGKIDKKMLRASHADGALPTTACG
ncbi:long-chain fatty acid--CoA ligase [Streptomyces mirabilis]|uniref:long-chain fatty acid--CoA ligase n=1 Tax=Streptomyces mirabilis TaxID=68239 RepID=UPI0036D0FF72